MHPRTLAPFTTARLSLRPFVPEDSEQAFAIFGDKEVMQYSLSDGDADSSETAERIAGYIAEHEREGFGVWAMVDRGPGRLVGIAGLRRLQHGSEVELVWRLKRDRQGQG